MSYAQKQSPLGPESESIKDRIRLAIDSADRTEAAILLTEAARSHRLVPIAAVSIYCSGDTFLSDYAPYVDFEEKGERFFVDLAQFRAIHACILRYASSGELKKVSDKHRNTLSKQKYGDGDITIERRPIKPAKGPTRLPAQYSYRIMVRGESICFPVGTNGRQGLAKAHKIRRAVKDDMSIYDLLKKFHPGSRKLAKLEAMIRNKDGELPMPSSPTASAKPAHQEVTKPTVKTVTKETTIKQVVDFYLKTMGSSRKGVKTDTAKKNIAQLRKILLYGQESYQHRKWIISPPKNIFNVPVSFLTEELVDEFQEYMLMQVEEGDYINEIRVSNSANSTLRQARSVFSKKAMAQYRKGKLSVEYPFGFMNVPCLPTTSAQYTPSMDNLKGLFAELSYLREANVDHYIVRMLGLFVGLRPSEIKWLEKGKVYSSGYWKVAIEVTKHFMPKKYHIRRVKIPIELGEHLSSLWKANGSEFVVSGHETYRTSDLFREINPHLRDNFLPDVQKPSYDMRKIFASACSLELGFDVTHRRMGHKLVTTTQKFYIDPETPQELVDIYYKYAKELYGGKPFAEK